MIAFGTLIGSLTVAVIPSYAAEPLTEGISDSGPDAERVKVWYRCDGTACEYEAVLDQQLSDDAIEYHWEFSDGKDIITTDPMSSHTWATHGSKTATLSVYNEFCELFAGEAQFSIPDPSVVVVGTDPEGVDGEPPQPDPVGALPVENGTLSSSMVLAGQNTLRSISEPLEGISLSGDAFIYIDSIENASRVAFELVNSDSNTVFSRAESTRPYDLAGGSAIEARPFDTRDFDDGSYRLSVAATFENGQKEYLVVAFNIANTTEPEPTTGAAMPSSMLVVSNRSNRSRSLSLAGATVDGNVYVSLTGDDNVNSVEFYLNDVSLQGRPVQVENTAPWDAFGGSRKKARAFNTRTFENGQHVLSAKVIGSDETYIVHSSFMIDN